MLRIAGHLRQGQLGAEEWGTWMVVWAAYFAVVLGGSALLLWRRRNVTSVYNVEPAVVEQLLARVLDGLGLAWMRAGNRYAIRPGPGPEGLAGGGALAGAGRAVNVGLVHAADPAA